MKTTTKMTMASAIVACGFAATAASASAYSFSPASTAFTGTGLNAQTFKIGATGPTVSCTTSTFTGSTPASGPTASFTAAFSGTGSAGSCPAGVLGNVSITVSGPWDLTVTGGAGPFTGNVAIPSGSTIAIKPLTVPTCTISISSAGNGSITGVSGANVSGGARLYGSASGITYTATSGCPGVASGTRADAVYNTGGTSASGGVSIPGVTVNP